MTASNIIQLQAREARLKRRIREHFRKLGFERSVDGSLQTSSLDKDAYRAIHAHQRAKKLDSSRRWLTDNAPHLIQFFASGDEIDATKISPRLEPAPGGSPQGDLFRFAGLYWRIPISEGYGRRMRFVVWDEQNGKLIGLIALGDAVFNLHTRDALIGWDHRRRADALVNLMDAYVLGAVPPYNLLLGGKLVAALARTREIVDAFDAKYRESVGVISNRRKDARLVAITTSSALGRSSVYNRLKLGGRQIFQSIGYTSGWGHFHISDALFEDLREFLIQHNHAYGDGNKFGEGPNWRLRVIRQSLSLLGLDPDLTRHGFPREVFFCPVADNAIKFLNGKNKRPRYGPLPTVEEIGRLARDRWLVPRALRMPNYVAWDAQHILSELNLTDGSDQKCESGPVCTGRKIS